MGDIREKMQKREKRTQRQERHTPLKSALKQPLLHSPRESLHFAATVGVAGASERLSDRQSSQNIAIIEPGR